MSSLPPATKLGQGYVFKGMCDSVHRGACWGAGGMRGCWGHAWLPGGAGLLGGVCVDARGA